MNELIIVLDIETTGTNCMNDDILEVGVLVANKQFQTIAKKSVLLDTEISWDRLPEIVSIMHSTRHPSEGFGRSLFEDIADAKNKKTALSHIQASNRLIGFMEAYGADPKANYMTGSTIGFDRGFLQVYMPELDDFFHYRSVDVSGLQAAIEMFYEEPVPHKPTDRKIHRTEPDCEDSLMKYKWAVSTLKGGSK